MDIKFGDVMNRKETRLYHLNKRLDKLISDAKTRKPTEDERKEFQWIQKEIEMLEVDDVPTR